MLELSQEHFSESHLSLGKWVSASWGLGDEGELWVDNEGFGKMGKGGLLGMLASNFRTKSSLYEGVHQQGMQSSAEKTQRSQQGQC